MACGMLGVHPICHIAAEFDKAGKRNTRELYVYAIHFDDEVFFVLALGGSPARAYLA